MPRLPPSPEIGYGTPSATGQSKIFSTIEEEDDITLEGEEVKGEIQMSPRLFQKIGAELVGTFILMFIGCGSAFVAERGNITLAGVASAWSLAVVAMIYTLGHISGAHFNPAVTIAFAVVGKFPWKEVPYYVLSQLASAIVACEVLQLLFDENKASVMLTLPEPMLNDLNVFAWEIIASFILMWVISGAASDHRAVKELAGLAIGAAIFIDVLITGKVTGASMNPARSLGPAVAARNFKKIWIYLTAPVIGTTLAAAAYNLLQSPSPEKNIKVTKQVTPGISRRVLNPAYSEKSMDLP